MAYFPMCIDLTGAPVILAGEGKAAREKQRILEQFGAAVHPCPAGAFEEALLKVKAPALVVVAGAESEEKQRISAFCKERKIPVNVVDEPALCSFFFPALICRGDLTVSVSTGGKSPGAAAHLKRQIEKQLPEDVDVILEELSALRKEWKQKYPEWYREMLREEIAWRL